MKMTVILAALMVSFSALASDYAYTCAFENGMYVKTDKKARKMHVVVNGEKTKFKISRTGLVFTASQDVGTDVLNTENDELQLRVSFPLVNGEKDQAGRVLDSRLFAGDVDLFDGKCIKDL